MYGIYIQNNHKLDCFRFSGSSIECIVDSDIHTNIEISFFEKVLKHCFCDFPVVIFQIFHCWVRVKRARIAFCLWLNLLSMVIIVAISSILLVWSVFGSYIWRIIRKSYGSLYWFPECHATRANYSESNMLTCSVNYAYNARVIVQYWRRNSCLLYLLVKRGGNKPKTDSRQDSTARYNLNWNRSNSFRIHLLKAWKVIASDFTNINLLYPHQ